MKKLWNKYRELLLYIIFGLLTTAVSWCSYVVFANVCRMSVFAANLASWVCSVAFAYVTNKLWVFRSMSWKAGVVWKEAVSFVSSRAITGVLEILGVPLLAKLGFDALFYTAARGLGLTAPLLYTQGIYSKLAFAAVVIVCNYIFSKLFVFKKKK